MAQRGVGPRRRTVRREEAKDDEQEQGTATLRLATYAPVFPCMPQTVLSAALTQPWSRLPLNTCRYNIRTVVDRWWGGRKTMLLDTIRDVDADVMCLQVAKE